jgi:hypothetical protein
MSSQAKALGALFNESALAPYESINAENALGMKHESWSVIWGFPRSRSIDTAANLANSVPIRYGTDSTYRPPNLASSGSALASSYGTIPVVNDVPPGPNPILASAPVPTTT